MASFFEMLAMNAPNIQTRKALILVGLQNDFLSPTGILASNADDAYIGRIEELATDFRRHGSLIWVRSEYDPAVRYDLPEDEWTTIPRPVIAEELKDDLELFLDPDRPKPQACLIGSAGAQFHDKIRPLVQPQDIQLVKAQYSAFSYSNLLSELRCRLITKLYICGALSNVAVYTTAIDAARSGMEIVLVEDCLAYRHEDRHERALQQLSESSAARILRKDQVLHFLKHPEEDVVEGGSDESRSESYVEGDEVTTRLDAMEVDDEASGDFMPLSVYPAVRMTAQRHRFAELLTKNAKMQLANDDSTLLPASSRDIYNNTCDDRYERTQQTRDESHTLASLKYDTMDIPHACLVKTWVADQEQLTMDGPHVAHCTIPLLGENSEAQSSGSTITYDLLDDQSAATAFQDISDEVEWQRMLHQTGEVPRLVCCQGTIAADGSMPVYRHPSDKTILAKPWTPFVDRIRLEAQKIAGHELNHGLIQLYRSGNDFISEHSDKTLDIVPGSMIVNVSLGAERTMRLRSKRVAGITPTPPRTTYRVRMPHNSMISMSLDTNAVYLHGINADKRPRVELTESELAYEGARVSLTFRQIGTFTSAHGDLIWGQGAVGKDRDHARPAVVADKDESNRLILAFGQENQSSAVDWHRWYGDGSNVLHLK